MSENYTTMKSRRYAVSLLIMAASVVVLNAQSGITQPPQSLWTAEEVIAGGGNSQN